MISWPGCLINAALSYIKRFESNLAWVSHPHNALKWSCGSPGWRCQSITADMLVNTFTIAPLDIAYFETLRSDKSWTAAPFEQHPTSHCSYLVCEQWIQSIRTRCVLFAASFAPLPWFQVQARIGNGRLGSPANCAVRDHWLSCSELAATTQLRLLITCQQIIASMCSFDAA